MNANRGLARLGRASKMIPTVGQKLTITGPDGSPRAGRVLKMYRSTGGFLSVWIDLDDRYANPGNQAATECMTRVLVLTERGGVYRDLWQERWILEASRPNSRTHDEQS